MGGSRTVCMVEGEAFAVATLAAQMERGAMAQAPIWSDLRTFDARSWRGVVDCVTGGYPCQPFSSAGQRRGESDPRHLWPDVARVLRECGPAICFFENVSGHMSLGAHEVIGELQTLGYRVACSLWTAEEVGAPHRRERLFILATHPERGLLRVEQGRGCGSDGPGAVLAREHGAQGAVADARSIGLEAQRNGRGTDARQPKSTSHGATVAYARAGGVGRCAWWEVEPDVGRVVDGVPARVDRLRALGNAVVPEQAARAFVELYDALA